MITKLTNFLLVAMIAFGAGQTYYAQTYLDGNTPAELIRNGLLFLVGVVGFVYINIMALGNWFASFHPGNQMQRPNFPFPMPPAPNNTAQPYNPNYPNNENHYLPNVDDYTLLMALRERFNKNKESFEMLAKLADSIFRGQK